MSPRKFDPEILRREMETQRSAFREIACTEMQRLGDARARLQTAWQEERNEDLLFELQRRAHKLAGRGGTFGFPQVSDTARALEVEMDRIIKSSAPLVSGDIDSVSGLVSQVETAVASMD